MPAKMLLVDGNSLMHRAFHALPVMTNEAGEYTNALHGFMMMLLRVMDEEKPELIAVAFDRHAPTFRHLKYDDYKAGRAPTPDELRAQFITIRELLAEMNITMLEMDGYEADDLLGSMSLLCEEAGIDAVIITGDRDAFQLAGEHTTVLYTKTGIKDTERVTPGFIREKYGVEPKQLIDVKGLLGDNSDNIPGIAGIGEKTALKLISQYGSLEAALDAADTEQKGKLRERLMNGRESAVFSKWLATIDRHAPLKLSPEECPVKRLTDGLKMLGRLQLRQIASRLSAMEESGPAQEETGPKPAELMAGELLDAEAFRAQMESAQADTIALSLGSHLSCALSDGRQFALKLGGDLIEPGVSEEQAAQLVMPAVLKAKKVVLHDLKKWRRLGLEADKNAFDVMLAAYLINP